ncbi:MAG TPA: hypothetical protein VFC19_41605 [Candidatus Limnocylindrales bacterium]|nr:hypothetical protein [Candidatus Limnocylindrales bacterium]
MTTTVTVPDHWELHADPDIIEFRRVYWERAADRLRPAPGTGEAGELARRMSGYLHDTAVLLRSAQEQLDYVWTRLLRRVIAVKEGRAVSIVLRNPADEVIVAKAVKTAREIRKHANIRLERLADSVDRDILPRMHQLLNA